jgi:ribosomal protein S18 acetylase RimI-like enzyme
MERRIEIRAYRGEDEADLFSLARSLFGDRAAWRDRGTLEVLERDVVFVAELSGRAAGYAALEREGDAVRIRQLLVGPLAGEEEHVETRLVAYAEGYAISEGARALQAVVEPDNAAAVSFYRGRGFVSVADELLELILPSRT